MVALIWAWITKDAPFKLSYAWMPGLSSLLLLQLCATCVCVCVVRKAKVTDDVTFNTAATDPLQHTDSALPPSVCILMMPQLRVCVSCILMYHYITETHLFSIRNDSNCRWRTIEARMMSFELMKIQCLIKTKALKNRLCLAAGTLRSPVWVVAVAS